MKVGIYIGHIDPQEGGGFTFQHSILTALSNIKGHYHQFVILHRSKVGSSYQFPHLSIAPEESRVNKVKQRIKKSFKKKLESQIDIVIKQNDIDLVWFPTYQFEPVCVPYIFTVWDLQHRLQPFFPEVTQNGQWETRENFYTEALKKASFVLTGTDRGIEEIHLFYQVHRDRIRKLPHPVPSVKEVTSVSIQHLIPDEILGKYIFYPAQFWPHKNHIRILEALHQLKTQHNILLPLVLVGSDKGTKEYLQKKAIDLDIEKQIRFLGFVSREELVTLYREAYALVYASLFGPENLPPLEAFALGCPGIVSDVPGAREQYGDAAFYFNPLNAIELANSLRNFMTEDMQRKKLIEKGLVRSLQYTSTDYANDILKIVDEMASYQITWKN